MLALIAVSSIRESECASDMASSATNIGALMITYTILGVSYYNHSIMGPKTLF